MESNMKDTHPDIEQLTGYMESPESRQYNTIRSHLMACDQCRGRVDKLTQLEFDIKHYVPRFSQRSKLLEGDVEQDIERFVDKQLDAKKSEAVKQRVDSDAESLKAALHYATHSSAMRKNIDDVSFNSSKREKRSVSSPGSIFSRLLIYLQRPAPVWTMAPATLLLAAIISLPLLYSDTTTRDTGAVIAKFQDNAVVSFSSADIPAGSIGFFHDAKSHSKPFGGIDITMNANKGLDLSWQAINKAKSYSLTVYSFESDQKQEIATTTTELPMISINNINWETGKHYQWEISGITDDGLKFSTQGDFVFIDRH